ncbi:ubiquitin system component Cue protein [Striga asiatica]|uniref:Ubiquitin system component Cue protein n=1 Tax=Striga asiatica TaxID=4170 RepID=A0A5A7PVJ5_STRAF|nr:ubiquitin system component Cue protein [Striga asiatica]
MPKVSSKELSPQQPGISLAAAAGGPRLRRRPLVRQPKRVQPRSGSARYEPTEADLDGDEEADRLDMVLGDIDLSGDERVLAAGDGKVSRRREAPDMDGGRLMPDFLLCVVLYFLRELTVSCDEEGKLEAWNQAIAKSTHCN